MLRQLWQAHLAQNKGVHRVQQSDFWPFFFLGVLAGVILLKFVVLPLL